jgi:hypothetical protein
VETSLHLRDLLAKLAWQRRHYLELSGREHRAEPGRGGASCNASVSHE